MKIIGIFRRGYHLALHIHNALTPNFNGNPLHILICRLTAKSSLKTWVKSKKNIYSVVALMKDEANEIYNQLAQNRLNDNLIYQYNLKTEQIHSIMRKIAIDNEQRMKVNWLVKGYRPTNFFYNRVNVVKPKQGSNQSLNLNGTWSSTLDKLAYEAVGYFTDLFSISQATRQFPGIICKKNPL